MFNSVIKYLREDLEMHRPVSSSKCVRALGAIQGELMIVWSGLLLTNPKCLKKPVGEKLHTEMKGYVN